MADAAKRLRKLDTRLAEGRQALRAIDAEQRKAQADVKVAEEALVAHFQREDHDPLPTDLHNNLAEARNRAEQPWQQRREGKQRLVQKLEQARAAFVQEHLGELAAVREHDAHAARDAVIEWLERGEVVERAWAEVEQWYTALLRPVPGIDGRDVPSLNLGPVKSEAQRVLEGGVPAPLPPSLYAAEDEDPTIRSGA